MIKFNETKKKNEIALVNIFKSINGEGYASGKPTVFIRTFGCNLRCVWCDTKESWTEENLKKVYDKHKELMWKTAEEIFSTVEEIEAGWSHKSICLTGGEPLHLLNTEFMMNELLPLFVDAGYDVGIETDGGIDYKKYKEKFGDSKVINGNGDRVGVTIIADYKLPSSGMTKNMIQSNFDIYSEMDLVKMVISDNEEDWKELDKVVNSGTKASIYLSPCFGSVTMHRIPDYVMANADKKIRAQIQVHKIFWDFTEKDV